MPWGKLESTFYNDPKFRRLSEALGLDRELGAERGAALARGFVSSLWSWAQDAAPDGHLPDSCSPSDVGRICGWPRGGERLYNALVAVGFIDVATDGPWTDRIIHRLAERAESSKAAKRKREQRERERAVARQSQDAPETRHGNVTGERGEREEKRERSEGREKAPDVTVAASTSPPPPSDSLRDVSASQVTADRAQRLCAVYRTAMKQEHGSEQPLIPPPKRVHEAKLVIAMAGGDDALAAAIVWAFVKSPGNRGFWSDKKHAFWLLTDPKDFEHAQQLVAGGAESHDDSEDVITRNLRLSREAEAAEKRGAS